MSDLKQRYEEEVRPQLMSEFGYKSPMEAPRLVKVTLNMGVGEATQDRKVLDNALDDLSKIAGQRARITRARKSEAAFKIRDGWPIGCMVTLRRTMMFEFIERLIGIAIPRMRDFRGLNPRSFDGRGNYSLGINEQIIFPEINYDEIDTLRGLDVAITTSAKNDDEGLALLRGLEFPFRS